MGLKKSQGLQSPLFIVYSIYGLHSKIYTQLLGSRECCHGSGAFSAFLKEKSEPLKVNSLFVQMFHAEGCGTLIVHNK